MVLACRNFGRFPKSQVKKLLKRSFARAVCLALLEEHSDMISRDDEVARELETLGERVVRAASARV